MGAPPLLPLPSVALSGLLRARPPIWRWPVALSARWPSARSRNASPPGVRACRRPWPPWEAASASVARVLWRSVRLFFCAGGGAAAWLSRPVSAARPAPSPSVSPPCRRPLAWFAPCCGVGRGGAASAPAGRLSVVGLGGLAAGRALFCVPSAGCRPASASCFAPAARLRALSLAAVPAFGWRWGGVVRSVSRGRVPLPPPRPRGAPPFPPSCSPSGRTRPEILAGAGGRALVPCSRWSQSVARGARALASPLSRRSSSRRWRARSACRAVCALPRLRAAVAPVVWLAGFGDEGCFVLQRPRVGDGHAPSGAQIAAHRRRFSPCFAHKILCTKNPRPEKYWQGTAGNGSRPQNRGE